MDQLIIALYAGIASAGKQVARDFLMDHPLTTRRRLKAHVVSNLPDIVPPDRRGRVADCIVNTLRDRIRGDSP